MATAHFSRDQKKLLRTAAESGCDTVPEILVVDLVCAILESQHNPALRDRFLNCHRDRPYYGELCKLSDRLVAHILLPSLFKSITR